MFKKLITCLVSLLIVMFTFVPIQVQAQQKDFHNHYYKMTKVIQESTCTEQGYAMFTCQHCGKTVERKINYAEHNFTEWEEYKKEEKRSFQVRECKVCGEQETRVVVKSNRYIGGNIVICIIALVIVALIIKFYYKD